MKDSKFWVWFIPVFLIVCVGVYVLINNANKFNQKEDVKVDTKESAKKIKEDYEKLNDTEGYIKVDISENNLYVLASDDDIKKLLTDGDGVIFFGEVSSFAARKELSLFNEVVMSSTIESIYYVNVASISDELNEYVLSKVNIGEIKAGDIVTIQNGNLVTYFDSRKIDNDKYLSDSEAKDLSKELQDLITELIEACDENC